MEKIHQGSEDEFENLLKSGEDFSPYLSGITINPATQGSSLMGDEGTQLV